MTKYKKSNNGAAKLLGQSFKKLRIGPMQGYLNFAVAPLLSRKKKKSGPDYLTLREALSDDLIDVVEVSEGGSVPDLRVVNKSSTHNVLLIDGEELLGAKQNRVLNASVLVAANTEVFVPVSCSEQGRWSYKSPKFHDSDKIMAREIRRRKSKSVSDSLHMDDGYLSDQSEVWAEIHKMQSSLNTHSPTSAMSDSYEARAHELNEYVSSCPLLPEQLGLVAFLNGKVAGCEMLSRPEAYGQVHRKVVQSYAVEALHHRRPSSEFPSPEKAQAFLKGVCSWRSSRFDSVGLGDDLRLEEGECNGTALLVEKAIVHAVAFGPEAKLN